MTFDRGHCDPFVLGSGSVARSTLSSPLIELYVSDLVHFLISAYRIDFYSVFTVGAQWMKIKMGMLYFDGFCLSLVSGILC